MLHYRGLGGHAEAVQDLLDNVSSGSGKMILLLVAGGPSTPDDGEIPLEGEAFGSLDASACGRPRRASIGIVFQKFHLVPYLTVLDNVLAPTPARPIEGARAGPTRRKQATHGSLRCPISRGDRV